MPGKHCYVRQRINRGNGHVTNDNVQTKNSCVSQALDMFCVTSSLAQIKCRSTSERVSALSVRLFRVTIQRTRLVISRCSARR